MIVETLNLVTPFLNRDVITLQPILVPRSMHCARFANVFLGDIACCIHDAYAKTLCAEFISSNLEHFSCEFLLSQFW